jgi:hypothetical protein
VVSRGRCTGRVVKDSLRLLCGNRQRRLYLSRLSAYQRRGVLYVEAQLNLRDGGPEVGKPEGSRGAVAPGCLDGDCAPLGSVAGTPVLAAPLPVLAPAACGGGEPGRGADGRTRVGHQGELFGGAGAVLLESSLARYCEQNSWSKESETAPFWAEEMAGRPPLLVSTRTDGGILEDFIYSAPRFKPTPPPPESRKGYSSRLSSKGARSIQAAAEIAWLQGTPFVAMWTFTVSDAHLADFLPADGYNGVGRPAKTVGSELRRFMRQIRQLCRRREWDVPEYAWAGESKSSGERDYHPHPHMLVTLLVKHSDFGEFAATAERLWGLGLVHMEPLRKPRNAAAYCLKGVSYSVKGLDGEQGRVWGRRYGVSRALRHNEERIAHVGSEAASDAVVEVAQRLRALDVVAVRTAYGAFTRRGFYPAPGVTWRQVSLAASIALAMLRRQSDEESRVGDPPLAEWSF